MSSYGFYIIDPVEFVGRSKIPEIAEILSKWMDPIVQKAGFSWSHVCFPQFIVTPQPYELMVYICSFEHSIVQFAPNAKGLIQDPMTSSHKGVTLIGPPAASEVYIKDANPLVIAALIFHEALHNKLQINNTMHTKFAQGALSVAEMMISEDIAPTTEENQAFSMALKKPVTQWADGQQILWNAAEKRRAGDSLWDDSIQYKT